jgi:hypothetical protein
MLQIDIGIHFRTASVVLVPHGVNPGELIRLNHDTDYGDEIS